MAIRTTAPKKRLTSLLTATVMAVSLVPAQSLTSLSAYAEEKSETSIGRLDAGKPRHGRGWSWDGIETLTLFGADLISASDSSPVVEPTCDIKVDLINYNKIELDANGKFIADYSYSVSFDGSGILDITSTSPVGGMMVQDLEINGGFIRSEPATISVMNDITVNGGYFEGTGTFLEFSLDQIAPGIYTQTGGYVNAYAIDSGIMSNVFIDGGYAEFMLLGETHLMNVQHGIYKCTNDGTNTIPDCTMIYVEPAAIAMFPNYSYNDISGILNALNMSMDSTAKNGLVAAGLIYTSTVSTVPNGNLSIYGEETRLNLTGNFEGSVYCAGTGYGESIYSNGATIDDKATLFGTNGNTGINISKMDFGDNTTVIGFSSSSRGVYGADLYTPPSTIIGVGDGYSTGAYLERLSSMKDVIGYQRNPDSYSQYGVMLYYTWADSVTGVSSGSGRGAYVRNSKIQKIQELTAYSTESAALCTEDEGIMPAIRLGAYSEQSDSPIKRTTESAFRDSEISFSDLNDRTIYALSGTEYITDAKLRDEIGNSVYMGVPLFDMINKDTNGALNSDIYAAAGSGEFLVDLVVTRQNSVDDISVTVLKDGVDVSGDFDIKVEKRTANDYEDEGRLATVTVSSKKDLNIGDEYDVVAAYGDSSAAFKMTVSDIDYSLNFTHTHGYDGKEVQWNYGGDFTGCEDNCSGSGWAWYGSAADGYEANTLVIDGLDFKTTDDYAILVPDDATIIVKGTNRLSSKHTSIYMYDGTMKILGEDNAKIIASNESCKNTAIIFMYYDGTLSIKDVDLEFTCGDEEYNSSGNMYASTGIYASNLIVENSDIDITCGTPLNGGLRVGISASSSVIRDNVNLTVHNGDLLINATGYPNSIKTLQAKKISNLTDFADEAAYNAAILDPNCFYDSSSYSSYIRIADSSVPATLSTYSITQVKTAKTDDLLTRDSTISVDLNACFEGGSGKYTFTAPADFPTWLQLTDGKVTLDGTIPEEDHSTRIFKFTVTDADADLAGEPIEFDFILGATGNVHQVKITSNYGGTVSPAAGNYYYVDGDSLTIEATPFEGYIAKAFLDGEEVTLTDGKYTISSIREEHEFAVKFQVAQFDVTVNCGEHGTVTPGTGKYNADSQVKFTAKPDYGYTLDSFKVNSTEIKPDKNEYTLTVTEDTIIDVTFKKTSGGGGGKPVNPGRPVNPTDPSDVNPSIDGRIFDWDQVVEYILSQPQNSTITVNLNGLTSVPKKVTDALQKMKDTGEFLVDSYRACVVYADREFTSGNIELGIMYSTVSVSGLRGTVGMKLNVPGSTVPYTLRTTFRKEFSGQIANIYRVTANGTEFVDAALIDSDGNALLDNAYIQGTYIVMIDALSDLPGDADNNGEFNALDAAAVIKHSAGTSTAANTPMADLNGDGRIDALDAAAMLRKIVG